MKESQMSDQLTMSWTTVVDEDGRVRLESRWAATSQAHPAHVTHAA